jgi:hypothetical protein
MTKAQLKKLKQIEYEISDALLLDEGLALAWTQLNKARLKLVKIINKESKKC